MKFLIPWECFESVSNSCVVDCMCCNNWPAADILITSIGSSFRLLSGPFFHVLHLLLVHRKPLLSGCEFLLDTNVYLTHEKLITERIFNCDPISSCC